MQTLKELNVEAVLENITDLLSTDSDIKNIVNNGSDLPDKVQSDKLHNIVGLTGENVTTEYEPALIVDTMSSALDCKLKSLLVEIATSVQLHEIHDVSGLREITNTLNVNKTIPESVRSSFSSVVNLPEGESIKDYTEYLVETMLLLHRDIEAAMDTSIRAIPPFDGSYLLAEQNDNGFPVGNSSTLLLNQGDGISMGYSVVHKAIPPHEEAGLSVDDLDAIIGTLRRGREATFDFEGLLKDLDIKIAADVSYGVKNVFRNKYLNRVHVLGLVLYSIHLQLRSIHDGLLTYAHTLATIDGA